MGHDGNPTILSSDGRSLDAKVIGTRVDPDIAVLQTTEDLPNALEWADTEGLNEGDHVVGLGYPVPGTDFSASPGTVVSFQTAGGVRVGVRTDAAVDRGNSGGPLLTSDGQVAGVITEMADNSGGFQVVPVAYTSAHLSDDVSAMIDDPDTPARDCRWVGGGDEYPDIPYEPFDDPWGEEGMDDDDIEPYEVDVPEPTYPATTTLPCPTGEPSVSVTEVRSEPIDPDYSPGYWNVTVKGTVRNDTSAVVDVYNVTVMIDGASTDSYGSVSDYSLRPGASTTFTADEYYFESQGPPGSASATLDGWSWGSWEFFDCGTG